MVTKTSNRRGLSFPLPRLSAGGAGTRAQVCDRKLNFSHAAPDSLSFPSDFLFGASTAAHQVEGGTTNNNWARWEGTTRKDGRQGIFSGERCGQAADHWRLFEEDLERMRELGLDMYRFSIEWSRIEPREGDFDEAAIQRYRSWCEQLQAAGIKPMVTLHHFSEPLWVTNRGGFESRETVDAFARFVAYVVPRLADVVDHWVTVNEPVVYAVLGWWYGEFPPGKNDPKLMARVLEHLLLAHAEAYHLIHALDQSDADGDGVACLASTASNIIPFEPARAASPVDTYLARLFDRNYNHAALEAMETGRFRLSIPGFVQHDVTHPRLAGTWDYAGVNHYYRFLAGIQFLRRDRSLLGFDPCSEKNDMGWDLTAQSLYDALHLAARYGKPIYITENGTCDAGVPDLRRQRFLLECLYAVDQAIRDGLDVRAYLHWSLLDNFEWAHGFGPRFGLYRVDFATQERTLTQGGELYRRIIAVHRARKCTMPRDLQPAVVEQ